MDLKRVLSFPPYPGDYLHPVVYACTAVMLLCLLVSITTYIVHHSMIRINRNGWHTLLNFLFHIGLTFGVFAGGINLINQPFLCQIVGIVLHYASLSTMLWLTYIARNICNDVSKDPLQAQDEIEPAQTHTQPTVLRFYLVSDGIPLIIVAVTAAFSMENYGSRDDALYCWMAWEPSLGGFYLPMILLVLVMTMCFLVAIIKLKRHPERKYELRVLSEERQQLSSPESHHHCHTDKVGTSGPVGDGAPINTGASALANEHSFKSQLRATAFTLFLFLSTWALGALAVTLGHFLDMIFSCLYGAFCVTLGLFLLIQHCAKRDDVWHRWWVCCSSVTKTEDGNGEAKRQEVHQPHCNLNSSKQLLLSTNLMQSSFHRTTPPPQSPTTNHKGLCCVAVLSPIDPSTRSPLMEPMPSPCQQSLQDELSRVPFPLQRCPSDRSKSQPFTRPLPCLQDYCSHLTSTSMDGSMHSSHLDSPLAAHHCEGSSLVSNGSHFDLQLPCSSLHLDKQLVSCQALQRQTSCQSVQDSVLSCHANNMHNSITSFHSMLLPSHEFHTCQWPLCNSASHCSNTDYCEKSDLFTLQYQYQQGPDCHSSISKPTDKEKNHNTFELEQRGMPRNTLPRQHTMLNRRGPLGRNRSLQEDGLFGSDTTQNIRTGPWKNETTV